MSEQNDDSTATVFATAKPISPADLGDNETATRAEAPATEIGDAETAPKGKTTAAKASGAPPWHLTAALGLVIALAGGLLLWLQSPLLAMIVAGGLIVLVGLGLALRHLIGRQETRSQSRGTGTAPGGTSQSQNRTKAPRDRSQSRETGPNRSRRPRETENGRETRRRNKTARQERPHTPETADQKRTRRPQPAPAGQKPRGNSTGRPQNDGKTPPRGRTPQTGRLAAFGGPSGGPTPPRDARPFREMVTCGGHTPDKPVRPPKDNETDKDGPKPEAATDKPTQPDVETVETAPETAIETLPEDETAKTETRETETKDGEIVWPTFDHDWYARMTIPRRAVKLPPVYHRNGEPQWPTEDPDGKIDIPSQRDRRGSVATPDQLTPGQWEQHWIGVAATATVSAENKSHQAHEAIAAASDMEGMHDPEVQRRREETLQTALALAHDAQVREALARLATELSRRKN